jgi:hypothetical protein
MNAAFQITMFLGCGLALIGNPVVAGGQTDAKDKVKELQKKRLDAATVARDYLSKKWRDGSRDAAVADEVWTPGFNTQLLDSHRQVLQARLDLCATKAQRTAAIEASIKDFEPILTRYEQYYQTGIVDSTPPFRLGQALMLEMQVALEKAKLEPGSR